MKNTVEKVSNTHLHHLPWIYSTQFCSDYYAKIWMTAKQNFQIIWILMEKLFMKCDTIFLFFQCIVQIKGCDRVKKSYYFNMTTLNRYIISGTWWLQVICHQYQQYQNPYWVLCRVNRGYLHEVNFMMPNLCSWMLLDLASLATMGNMGANWALDRDRDQSRYVLCQWETSLHCNDVSHWLGTYLDWSL